MANLFIFIQNKCFSLILDTKSILKLGKKFDHDLKPRQHRILLEPFLGGMCSSAEHSAHANGRNSQGQWNITVGRGGLFSRKFSDD